MVRHLDLIAQAHVLPAFLAKFVECLTNRPDEQVGHFYASFEQQLGVRPSRGRNAVFTPGALLAVLYVLIVYPQERFMNAIPKIRTNALDPEKWGRLNWHIPPPPDLRGVVRRLRNALAHANVELTSEFGFQFRDRRDENAPFDFDVSIDLESVRRFVEELTRQLVLTGRLGPEEPG